MCTEICFSGACFRSKLPRVYWLGYLPGSVFRERVSGASSFVCTGWSTYPGACFASVFQEQAPSCVPAFIVSRCLEPLVKHEARVSDINNTDFLQCHIFGILLLKCCYMHDL